MRRYLQEVIFEVAYYIEILISIILAVVLVELSFTLLVSTFDLFGGKENYDVFFQIFVNRVLTLAIGVELIKMLVKHTPGTVIEVLVFAVARQLVMNHDDPIALILGMLALATLFVIRKYLFTAFDDTASVVVRASEKIKIANIIARVKIPSESNITVRQFMMEKLEEADKTVAIGASVYLKDIALRVDSMHGDKITRVEIIRALR